MKKMLAIAFIPFMSVASAYAQTVNVPLNDLPSPNVIGGYHMSPNDNNVFTKDTASNRSEALADTIIPGTQNDAKSYGTSSSCPLIATMNGGWAEQTNVNADCTPQSLNPGSGGFAAQYINNGSITVGTCDTTTKTLGNINFVDFTIEVSASSSSRDGSC